MVRFNVGLTPLLLCWKVERVDVTLEEFQRKFRDGQPEKELRNDLAGICDQCRGHLSFSIHQTKSCRGDSSELVTELRGWLQKDENLQEWSLHPRFIKNIDISDGKLKKRFADQTTAIVMCCLCCSTADSTFPKLEEAISQIVTCLKSAFPKLSNAIGKTESEETLPQLYREDLKNAERSAWLVLAADLLQEIRDANDSVLQPVGFAETPVLIAHDGIASVFMLRVELFEDGIVGIFPRLSSFGSILLDDDLCESTVRVWKASRVVGKRIVWSLNPYTVSESDKVGGCIRLTRVGGRSMEAAMLAAIWAANGGIPGDTEFQMPSSCRMERSIAVTASIQPDDSKADGRFLLSRVEYTDVKLRAARKEELYGVLISSPEEGAKAKQDEETQKVVKELEDEVAERQKYIVSGSPEARKAAIDYPGLVVAQISTAREVFDSLLVTNRWLAKWQADTRENWLKRWECRPKDANGNFVHGGARAPRDDAPGPDDMNLPRQTEQA
jgi:hypothetical protein